MYLIKIEIGMSETIAISWINLLSNLPMCNCMSMMCEYVYECAFKDFSLLNKIGNQNYLHSKI